MEKAQHLESEVLVQDLSCAIQLCNLKQSLCFAEIEIIHLYNGGDAPSFAHIKTVAMRHMAMRS